MPQQGCRVIIVSGMWFHGPSWFYTLRDAPVSYIDLIMKRFLMWIAQCRIIPKTSLKITSEMFIFLARVVLISYNPADEKVRQSRAVSGMAARVVRLWFGVCAMYDRVSTVFHPSREWLEVLWLILLTDISSLG